MNTWASVKSFYLCLKDQLAVSFAYTSRSTVTHRCLVADHRNLYPTFPLADEERPAPQAFDPSPILQGVYRSTTSATHTKPGKKSKVIYSGEYVASYARNDAGVLPEGLEQALRIASDLVGMDTEVMLNIMWVLERKLDKLIVDDWVEEEFVEEEEAPKNDLMEF